MTGYGNSKGSFEGLHLDISIRSVNGRFFEVRTHIPREYLAFERELKKNISEVIRRGTVDVYISRKSSGDSKESNVSIAIDKAKSWQKSYEKLAKTLKVQNDFSLATLVSQEKVISFEESSEPTKNEMSKVLDHLKKALTSCEKERKREGLALKKDLQGKLLELKKISESITKLRSDVNAKLQDKLRNKWENLNLSVEIDPQRIAQEIVLLVDKSDIDEEVTRLKEHLQRMKDLTQKKEPVGKKLDFYTQELLREVNTIGSKSSLSSITEKVVIAKSIVEQIREQVQNIE